MTPNILKNNPTNKNYIVVETTFTDTENNEQAASLNILLFNQYRYKAKKRVSENYEEPTFADSFNIKLYNIETDTIKNYSVSIDENGRLYVLEDEKIYLDEFSGNDDEFIDPEISSNGLSEKIVLTTLNYSNILLNRAMEIAVKLFQNSSREVVDLNFDTDNKVVEVVTVYRHKHDKRRVETYPWDMLWSEEI